MTNLNLTDVNTRIIDRTGVFYWQTDRKISVEEAGTIWTDRHQGFSDQHILDTVNKYLSTDKLASIEPHDPDAQTNLGNVSSVRIARRESGQEVILRCFPLGIKNGYFYVESQLANLLIASGLPSYKTYLIHEVNGPADFAFHMIEKLPGSTLTTWLEKHKEDEEKLLFSVGKTMAGMHKVQVDGFGPFNNKLAKEGKLKGLHNSFASAINAALEENLKVLTGKNVFTKEQESKIITLFDPTNTLLQSEQAVLVHNDFADWNQLCDGDEITGIIDLDESVGGDPISDIACWSTFFDPERTEKMLKGYWSSADKPSDFKEKFELLRFRYTISKMTLRLRRYEWDRSELLKNKIEVGKQHLTESIKYFDI